MKGIVRTVLPFALIAALVIAVICLPRENTGSAREKTIVEIWNVDTFEGGKGSRTAFLNKIARKFGEEDVYFYVTSYTVEGARAAFSRGTYPDVLSYGLGLGEIAERCLVLPYAFAGGSIGGKCLAVPWCAGKYMYFSLSDDFDEEGKTAISHGGSNLPSVAAKLSGVKGEEILSENAYVGFLNGEYRYLFGTQRDENRFRARNVTVFCKEVTEYNDLFQYISILSKDKKEICLKFLDNLLSETTRGSLGEIGMYPSDAVKWDKTLSVFTSDEGLHELTGAAQSEKEIKFLEKYLKSR